jgi:hypothetical protein
LAALGGAIFSCSSKVRLFTIFYEKVPEKRRKKRGILLTFHGALGKIESSCNVYHRGFREIPRAPGFPGVLSARRPHRHPHQEHI